MGGGGFPGEGGWCSPARSTGSWFLAPRSSLRGLAAAWPDLPGFPGMRSKCRSHKHGSELRGPEASPQGPSSHSNLPASPLLPQPCFSKPPGVPLPSLSTAPSPSPTQWGSLWERASIRPSMTLPGRPHPSPPGEGIFPP